MMQMLDSLLAVRRGTLLAGLVVRKYLQLIDLDFGVPPVPFHSFTDVT